MYANMLHYVVMSEYRLRGWGVCADAQRMSVTSVQLSVSSHNGGIMPREVRPSGATQRQPAVVTWPTPIARPVLWPLILHVMHANSV